MEHEINKTRSRSMEIALSASEDTDIAFLNKVGFNIKEIIINSEPFSTVPCTEVCDALSSALNKCKETMKECENIYMKEVATLDLLSAEHHRSNTNIDDSLKHIIQSKVTVAKDIEDLVKTLKIKDQEFKQLQEHKLEAERVPNSHLPKIYNEYKLLTKTFAIKFDHTAPESKVIGNILRPSTKQVIPFELDQEKNSQYFITNYLWQQLGTPDSFFS